WGSLLTAVRTGQPAYRELFGRPFWEDLDAHPDIAASFDALMGPAGHGVPDPEVLIAGDWQSVRSVVDVGGGAGPPAWPSGSRRSGRASSTRCRPGPTSTCSRTCWPTGRIARPGRSCAA